MGALLSQPLLLQLVIGLIASGLVWHAACLLHRWLKWPDDSRAYWWGVLVLMLSPLPLSRLLPEVVAARIEGLLPMDYELVSGGGSALAELASTAFRWPDPSMLLVGLYAAGLGLQMARAVRGHLQLRRILADTRPLTVEALPGARSRRLYRALSRRRISLRWTTERISPFALSSPAQQIVLPQALLQRLDDCQCWLLLRHEAAHLQHRDPLWMRLLSALCALHWFNPFVWKAARRLRLATELRCDRPAIRQKHMRRAYAEAYLETLRMSAARALPCPAAAFSAHDKGHHKMRIAHILSATPAHRKSPWRLALLVAAALGAAATLTAAQAAGIGRLEVAMATVTAPGSTSPANRAAPAFRGPIIGGRVSSSFGNLRPTINAQPHRGIDLMAARGTPVRSPAAGRVLSAEANYSKAPNYGTVVVLDHGDGWQTLYAHLDSFAVKPGDTVQAGDTLGTVGSTGIATGPHVHVEVHRDGQRVDPAQVIENIVVSR